MRAQIYSIVAVMAAVPLFLFIAYYISSTQTLGFSSSEKIVADQMHDVDTIIGEDFIRALKISGRRSLLALVSESLLNGTYISNSNDKILELLLNGTMDSEQNSFMYNNTLQYWKDRILSIPVGFDVNIDYSNLTVENLDGFNIEFSVDFIINISERTGKMRIDKTTKLETTTSTTGLEDPLFPINTLGFGKRVIERYPYSVYSLKLGTGQSSGSCSGNATFNESDPEKSQKILVTHNASAVSGFLGVVSETSDVPSAGCYIVGVSGAVDSINQSIRSTGFPELYLDNSTDSVWYLPVKYGIENGYYFPEPGPDFFQRLEGNLTNQTDGYQTFVNTQELEELGISIKPEQSRTDYLYFSEQTINGDPVRGLPDWFRIDTQTAGIYNLTELME
jgi:hypothetical protein